MLLTSGTKQHNPNASATEDQLGMIHLHFKTQLLNTLRSRSLTGGHTPRNAHSLLVAQRDFDSVTQAVTQSFTQNARDATNNNNGSDTEADNDSENEHLPSVEPSSFGLSHRLVSADFKSLSASSSGGNRLLLLHKSGDVYEWFGSSLLSADKPSSSSYSFEHHRKHTGEERSIYGPSLVHALTWERALRGITIASVACGPHHCLALSTAPHLTVALR